MAYNWSSSSSSSFPVFGIPYNWRSSSYITSQPQIILQYTNCPYEPNHDVPHDCLYDLETCGLFEPSGPNGSPEANVCAACHYHRSLHRSVMVQHEMARSPPRTYQAYLQETFMRQAPVGPETNPSPPRPQLAFEPGPSVSRLTRERSDRCYRNLHRTVMVQQEMARLPPLPYQAYLRETFMPVGPETNPSPPRPQLAFEPGHPVSRLTRERSDRLRVIAERNNYKMFKDYTKAEVAQICAELRIKKRCMRDWISRHNVARRHAAARQAAAREAAARETAAREAAAREQQPDKQKPTVVHV